jgi:hypothetical protein
VREIDLSQATDEVALYLWIIRTIPSYEQSLLGVLAGRPFQGGEIRYLDLVRVCENPVAGQQA